MALAVGVGRGQTAVRIIGEREAASRTSTNTSFTTSTSIPSRLAQKTKVKAKVRRNSKDLHDDDNIQAFGASPFGAGLNR